jgi:hypothetical protein
MAIVIAIILIILILKLIDFSPSNEYDNEDNRNH